jgi:hypothetical protein
MCPQGHESEDSQDRVWQLGPGQASLTLAAILAWLAVDFPFDHVPEALEQTLGLAEDGEMVRRITAHSRPWAESQEPAAIHAARGGLMDVLTRQPR